MVEFRPSRISALTGTGALQIAPDPGKPGIFSVFNYIDTQNKQDIITTTHDDHSLYPKRTFHDEDKDPVGLPLKSLNENLFIDKEYSINQLKKNNAVGFIFLNSINRRDQCRRILDYRSLHGSCLYVRLQNFVTDSSANILMTH